MKLMKLGTSAHAIDSRGRKSTRSKYRESENR